MRRAQLDRPDTSDVPLPFVERSGCRKLSPRTSVKRHCGTTQSLTDPLTGGASDLRTREYLTEAEVERLIEAAKDNRWGHRDSTMLLIAFRHGNRSGKRNPARP
jgi:hypothetical protein